MGFRADVVPYLGLAGSTAAASLIAPALHASPKPDAWASRYDIDRSVANFDAAYYGAMTRSVAETYRQHGEWVNRHNALFLRSALPGLSRDQRLQPAIDSVAALAGAQPGEIALCAGGTVDFAARLTIPAAIAEHDALDPGRKLATLVAKRRYWADRVRDVQDLAIVHPEEGDRCAVIGAFRLPGQASWDQARKAQQRFLEKHRLLVVAKQGLASGPALRVTPSLFNTQDELDRLVHAIREERGLFS